MPMQHSREAVEQAQTFSDQFKVRNAERLHMFFLTYFEFSETQH